MGHRHLRGTRTLAAFVVSAATIAAAGIGLTAGAAGAQDELPSGPPADEAPNTGSVPGGIDFGDAVTVDENGVRWNVDAETGTAADPATPAQPGSGEDAPQGTAGTGELERIPASGSISETTPAEGPDETPVGAREPIETIDVDAGSGSSTFVLVGIVAVVAALALAVVAVLRRRKGSDDLIRVEEPIVANATADPEFSAATFDGGYDGASDAGAYEEGGAAYAQYAAAATGETPDLTAETISTRDRITTMRAAVVDRADKGLADSGRAKGIATKLEAAGSNTRPGEWLVMTVGLVVGAFCFVAFVAGIIFGVIAGAAAAYASWFRLAHLEGKRQKAFSDDLPETLQLLAGSLRGGQSMLQAIQTVADEADEPTASEFQRLITEARLGRDLAVSFRDLSRRMDSKDFDWVVTAIEIHREVGGDLSSILDRVGNTIRARNQVLGQVKALSAEGRMSGLLLFMLPPGMLAAISALNPEYLQEMIGETAGQIMLAVAMVLLGAGGLWLKKLSKFVY
ncbi:MAG: type II secretion system F family protein [Acidimicrobiales bacterium]